MIQLRYKVPRSLVKTYQYRAAEDRLLIITVFPPHLLAGHDEKYGVKQ